MCIIWFFTCIKFWNDEHSWNSGVSMIACLILWYMIAGLILWIYIYISYNVCNIYILLEMLKRGTGQDIGIRSESPRPIPGFRFAGAPSFWPIDIRFIVSRKNQGFPENIYTSSYPIQTKVIYNVLNKCVPSFCMEHLRGPNDVIVQ